MTTKWSGSCVGVVSSVSRPQQVFRLTRRPIGSRHYATKTDDQKGDIDRYEKAALVEIQGIRKGDLINPPRSTRPPPLTLPERGDANVAVYYFRIGRAHGSFYLRGIKAVWFNHKAKRLFVQQVRERRGAQNHTPGVPGLTRSQYQLWVRNDHDIGKLPFFGLLVALFGEWLPLIVPFIPNAVPGTCRVPKQVADMRKKAEERRRIMFRGGIEEPNEEQLGLDKQSEVKQPWPTANKDHTESLVARLRDDQLLHLSSTLNLHSRLWDRFQLPPPSFMLRRSITRRLKYLGCDDKLLVWQQSPVKMLESEEVHIACEERGLDVLGKHEESLRETLRTWLEYQEKDNGRGVAMLKMLFRRPNAWNTKQGS